MLYIIATPIGNLKDISFRAIDILKSVDLIIAEDTRVTKKLCAAYDISTQIISVHEHTEPRQLRAVVDRILEGETAAVVTDAGTPAIADPGVALVRALRQRDPDAKIIPIPGASSVIAALSVSGLWANQFTFLGFPPHHKGREKFFAEVEAEDKTVVFFEATNRIQKTIDSLAKFADPARVVVVCRELTKQFEHVYFSTVGEISSVLPSADLRGEFVIVVEAKQ